eukprot:3896230-Prymnesium_polylepis.2
MRCVAHGRLAVTNANEPSRCCGSGSFGASCERQAHRGAQPSADGGIQGERARARARATRRHAVRRTLAAVAHASTLLPTTAPCAIW